MTTYGHRPINPSGPDDNAGLGGNLRTYLPAGTLSVGLVRDHTTEVLTASVMVALKLLLATTGLWRALATALNALPAGLGVNLSYRPERRIPTPAYQALRAVSVVREGLASGARGVSTVMSAHQRAAFRVDEYLLDRRVANYPNRVDDGDGPDLG